MMSPRCVLSVCVSACERGCISGCCVVCFLLLCFAVLVDLVECAETLLVMCTLNKLKLKLAHPFLHQIV